MIRYYRKYTKIRRQDCGNPPAINTERLTAMYEFEKMDRKLLGERIEDELMRYILA